MKSVPTPNCSRSSRGSRLLIQAGKLLGLEPNLWQVQNRFLSAFAQLSERGRHGAVTARRLRPACRRPERQRATPGLAAVKKYMKTKLPEVAQTLAAGRVIGNTDTPQ